MYKSRVLMEKLRNRDINESTEFKSHVKKLTDLKDKIKGFGAEAVDITDIISELEDLVSEGEMDKKVPAEVEKEYLNLENSLLVIKKSVKNITNIIRGL
jgi:hypothetical protein